MSFCDDPGRKFRDEGIYEEGLLISYEFGSVFEYSSSVKE